MRLLATLRAADGERSLAPSAAQETSQKNARRAIAGAMALATIAVLASRRTSTLTEPYLWAEDGLDIVPQFVMRGWGSLLDPISGYMALIPRIISYVSLALTPSSYPLTSTVISWVFMAGVLAFIALAPTLLKARPWIALACLFVPTDPEVFGTSLYSFWWAGLLLMLLAMWEYTPRHAIGRAALTAVCGLSTPLIVLIAPLMALRALYLRTRHDIAIGLVAVVCALLQMRQIVGSQTDKIATEVSWRSLQVIFDKFFGRFSWGMDLPSPNQEMYLALLGVTIAAIAMYALVNLKDRWLGFCLLYLLGGSIALSIARVSVEVMGPTGGGPRYFFYPYVVLSWILIQGLWTRGPHMPQALFAVPLVLALINATTSGWNRTTDLFSFQRHVQSCRHFEEYTMPIYIHGGRDALLRGPYPRAVCDYLATKMAPLDENELLPFRWLHLGHAAGSRQQRKILAQKDLEGGSGAPIPEGYSMLGTFNALSPTGEVTLELHRGDFLMFASGAGANRPRYKIRTDTHHFQGALAVCPENCTLAFTSDLLPETFTITLSDVGTVGNEWFAIGVPIPQGSGG